MVDRQLEAQLPERRAVSGLYIANRLDQIRANIASSRPQVLEDRQAPRVRPVRPIPSSPSSQQGVQQDVQPVQTTNQTTNQTTAEPLAQQPQAIQQNVGNQYERLPTVNDRGGLAGTGNRVRKPRSNFTLEEDRLLVEFMRRRISRGLLEYNASTVYRPLAEKVSTMLT